MKNGFMLGSAEGGSGQAFGASAFCHTRKGKIIFSESDTQLRVRWPGWRVDWRLAVHEGETGPLATSRDPAAGLENGGLRRWQWLVLDAKEVCPGH
jgi:hypothetical protein